MENTNCSTTGKIILAAVTGVVVGAALGILFAPDKGSETRSRLIKKTKGLGSGLKNKFSGKDYTEIVTQNLKRPPLI